LSKVINKPLVQNKLEDKYTVVGKVVHVSMPMPILRYMITWWHVSSVYDTWVCILLA